MPKKLVLFLTGFLSALAVVALLVITRQAKIPVLVSRTDPPKISFEERSHDLGNVAEGIEIPYTFKIHNIGGEPLKISNVNTSCGCTVLNLKDKIIEPGKTGDLEVIMDTTLKQGFVKKSIDISSNDPKKPKTQIFLSAFVQPSANKLKEREKETQQNNQGDMVDGPMGFTPVNPHLGLSTSGKVKIFAGKCAACHVTPGVGKVGRDLFLADCAMCHGMKAEGGMGPGLLSINYNDPAVLAYIQKTIRYGSASNLSMPGFAKEVGGPLTNHEIDTIVSYLKEQSVKK